MYRYTQSISFVLSMGEEPKYVNADVINKMQKCSSVAPEAKVIS